MIGYLRHNSRVIKQDKNTDIDPERTEDNVCLTPFIDIPPEHQQERSEEIWRQEYKHYREIIEDSYVYGRKDIVTMASWCVTLPKEITDPEIEKDFFNAVVDFISERYGAENIVSAHVHRDEGKHFKYVDKETGEKLTEWHEGQSHLHISFVPRKEIDHDEVMKKNNPVLSMLAYDQKVCAKEVINRKELQSFHGDLNSYINNVAGIQCNLNSGITQLQGGNRTVQEMKVSFDARAAEITRAHDKAAEMAVEAGKGHTLVKYLYGQVEELKTVNTELQGIKEELQEVKQERDYLKFKLVEAERTQGEIERRPGLELSNELIL